MRAYRPCRLRLDELEHRNLLASIFAIGESDGRVRIVDASTQADLVTDFFPLDTDSDFYIGLVQVALGDINNDGTDDVFVSAANPSGAAGLAPSKAGKVFVFDGATLAAGNIPTSPLRTFTPFATTNGPAGNTAQYINGLNIAVGDVNGDGTVDLIAGTRGGNGTAGGGNREYGRLVAIDGAQSGNVVLGSIISPFGSGYEKGVVVAAGDLNNDGKAEVAVTRGGPVASSNPNKDVRLKAYRFSGSTLTNLDLTGNGTTFAPFQGITGANGAVIERDARVTFVDADGDGNRELAFTALDRVTNPSNVQVRVAVYSVNPSTGKASLVSTGGSGNSTTYLVGSNIADHAITNTLPGTNGVVDLVLIRQAATSGVQILNPITGALKPGGFTTEVISGGITIASGRTGDGTSDIEAPTAPGTPTASNITNTELTLTWAAASDNIGVTGYTVLGRVGASGSFTTFATVSGTSVKLTGLTPGTLYNFAVTARDAAGNTSLQSGTVGVTTTGGGNDDAFEENDTRGTAANLGILTAPLTQSGLALLDDDWFRFTTTEVGLNGSVEISFDHALGDLDMELYDANGNIVGFAGSTSNTESISLGGLPIGTYSVLIYGYAGDTNPSYSLTITPPTSGGATDDNFEDNDTRDTAANLGTLTEVLNLDGLAVLDDDWFRFTTAGVGRSDSSVVIYFQNSLGDLDMELYDANGTLIQSSAGVTGSETISLTNRAAGTYYIRVFGFEGDTNPAYSMTIQPPPSDDVYEENDTRATAYDFGSLISELAVNNLVQNDDDWYSFTTAAVGTADNTVRIDFTHSQGDVELELYDANGNLLDSSTSSTNSETVSLDTRPAGKYFVRVYGFAGDTNPAYSIKIVPPIDGGGAIDDNREDNDTRDQAFDLGSLTGSKSYDGLIMNDAADWFRFTTTAPGTSSSNVQIFFQHSQGDLDLRLHDINGNLLASSTGTGASEQVSLNGRPAGTYYIEVYGFNGATNPNYALTVNAPTSTTPASGDHVLYLSTEGYNISRAELLSYAGNDWRNVADDFDSDANGISIQPFLAGRADREQVITAMIGHLQADLAPFGIEVRRINGGAVTGQRATTLFMGQSTLSNNFVHVAPVDIGNTHATDIAFVGNEDWGSAADTALALADVALHEAGHTWGLTHVQSGNELETMGLRYSTPQSQWLADTGFLNRTYNIRPGDGTGTQNSFEIMSRLFGLNGNPAPNPVGGLSEFSAASPTLNGNPCVCGVCASLVQRGVALGEDEGALSPSSEPLCVRVERADADGSTKAASPQPRTGIGRGVRLHPAPIKGFSFEEILGRRRAVQRDTENLEILSEPIAVEPRIAAW